MTSNVFDTTVWTDAVNSAGRDFQAAALKAQAASFDTFGTLLSQHFETLGKEAEAALAFGREAMAARDLESIGALFGKGIATARSQAEVALTHGRSVAGTLNRHFETLQALAEKQVEKQSAQVKPIKG